MCCFKKSIDHTHLYRSIIIILSACSDSQMQFFVTVNMIQKLMEQRFFPGVGEGFPLVPSLLGCLSRRYSSTCLVWCWGLFTALFYMLVHSKRLHMRMHVPHIFRGGIPHPSFDWLYRESLEHDCYSSSPLLLDVIYIVHEVSGWRSGLYSLFPVFSIKFWYYSLFYIIYYSRLHWGKRMTFS